MAVTIKPRFGFRLRGRLTALLTCSLFGLYFDLLKLKYQFSIMTMTFHSLMKCNFVLTLGLEYFVIVFADS